MWKFIKISYFVKRRLKKKKIFLIFLGYKHDLYKQRMKVYEKLLKYFPKHMKQPDASLMDFV